MAVGTQMRRILFQPARRLRAGVTRWEKNSAVDEGPDHLDELIPEETHVMGRRHFGWPSVEEHAEALGASVRAAERDWVLARSRLCTELLGGRAG
jgi:hypothetical protein